MNTSCRSHWLLQQQRDVVRFTRPKRTTTTKNIHQTKGDLSQSSKINVEFVWFDRKRRCRRAVGTWEQRNLQMQHVSTRHVWWSSWRYKSRAQTTRKTSLQGVWTRTNEPVSDSWSPATPEVPPSTFLLPVFRFVFAAGVCEREESMDVLERDAALYSWFMYDSQEGDILLMNSTSAVSRARRGTMKCLSAACWGGGGGGGVEGAAFDALRQYTCLQSPRFPFTKYISHIPMPPFNTGKCKERLTLQLGERYTKIPWELPGTAGEWGGGTMPVLSHFYRWPMANRCRRHVSDYFLR